jgi:hypothetical protein
MVSPPTTRGRTRRGPVGRDRIPIKEIAIECSRPITEPAVVSVQTARHDDGPVGRCRDEIEQIVFGVSTALPGRIDDVLTGRIWLC